MIARPTHKSALFTEANRASPVVRTKSEQLAEWLEAKSRERPLTDEESEQLRRALHAIYCHQRKHARECQAIEPRWRHLVAA